MRRVALDLDGVLADTRSLWRAWLEAASEVLGIAPDELPCDRGEAARALDELDAGNWRTLLARFAEDRVAVHVRRDPGVSAVLRALERNGAELGAFTDAPEPLARVALRHVGADRRIVVLETGTRARERLLARLGEDAVVVATRDELLALTAS